MELTTGDQKNSFALAAIGKHLIGVSPSYQKMLEKVSNSLPAMMTTSKNFYKSSSQFKMVTLDMTAITPLRSIEHTLAEITQTKTALENAYIGMRKDSVKLRKKRAELDACSDALDRELLQIELEEIELEAKNSDNYVKGAIRKLSYFTEQYNILMAQLGKDHITEEEYENEEYKYHIMTAFKQALSAARGRGGMIDEGNLLYMFDLGINAGVAQVAVTNYLQAEIAIMEKGEIPTHQMTLEWLTACAEQFKNNPESFALWRGLRIQDKSSLTDVTEEGA